MSWRAFFTLATAGALVLEAALSPPSPARARAESEPAGAPPAASRPATRAADLDPAALKELARQRARRDKELAELGAMKPTARYRLRELADVSVERGRIHATTTVPFRDGGWVRVACEDAPGVWRVSMQDQTMNDRPGVVPGPRPEWFFGRLDPGEGDAGRPWSTALHLHPADSAVHLYADTFAEFVRLSQKGGGVQLVVRPHGSDWHKPAPVDLRANSLAELRSRHPAEYRRYVLPMLLKFLPEGSRDPLRPGAADVYAALPEIRPDEGAARRVRELLPALGAESPSRRDQALSDLRRLGPAAVLAVLRLEPSELDGLTAEQKGRLADFLAPHRRRGDAPPDGNDPDFLCDCLDEDDPAVRSAAKARIEKLLRVPLKFDPALEGEARAAAADAVREKLRAAAG